MKEVEICFQAHAHHNHVDVCVADEHEHLSAARPSGNVPELDFASAAEIFNPEAENQLA